MIRHRLTDAQWKRIEDLIPGKPGDPGRTGDDNRLFVDAIVWMASENQLSWLAGHNHAFRRLGGIPAVIRVDNTKTAVAQGAGEEF